ncbi:hypothetical protein R1sor_009315 [Riccia sorocarpa]|uniref:H15 domain-containing protein n=1 Tax=Riccia sorocarpa TaxID=122646 RepID=A0ABD3I0X4_9MARC
MRGRSRSYSVCSSRASGSDLDDDDRYSDYSDASMPSSRSRSRSRRSSPGGSVGSDNDSFYSSRETSRDPSHERYSSRRDLPMDTRNLRQSIRSNAGLMRVVHSAVARLKKKTGAPIRSIKQDISENFGVNLAGAHNTQRLNKALKSLQKEGKLVKTQQGYKLVPHKGKGEQQARRRRRRRHKGRGRKRKGRRRRRRRRHRRHGKLPGKAGVSARRRRKGRKRRRRRRRRRGKSAAAPKPRTRTLRRRGKSNPKARRTGRKKTGAASTSAAASTRGDYTPPGARTSPRLPSRNPSRVPSRIPSRMPSRLPSRSHSPARAQFDPRETPPSRDSPGPHGNSLDDFDLLARYEDVNPYDSSNTSAGVSHDPICRSFHNLYI